MSIKVEAAALGALLALACGGADQPVGEIEGPGRAPPADGAAPDAPRILFGDLHVHSSYSIDALVFSLPVFGGEGAHPPADACDFARYCAAVDFFSINDHAEGLTPERWKRTIESIRDCNARSGDPADPDLVAFVGWEWTQVGATPETHYGHKNVIYPGLADDELPARPIAYLPASDLQRAPPFPVLRVAQWLVPRAYADFLWLIERMTEVPNCARGVDSRALPRNCRESADTPAELFEKLAQWQLDSLVIPHGLAWGVHAPRGARLDNQLDAAQHDPERQRLLEVWSGHGNSEEFRSRDDDQLAGDGSPVCPAPTPDFLPCCWRAGELMRERCGGLAEAECEARVEQAQRLALEAAVNPFLVFPDTTVDDWLDCDQCRDCFKPAFAMRPGETAQYGLALANHAELAPDGSPLRFRFGFIASTDNHTARPGTGYKQYDRLRMTDARGPDGELGARVIRGITSPEPDDPARPQRVDRNVRSFPSLLDTERNASFMYPGGLVAVHSAGRDRRSIWQALQRREVYGTSGPRIQLWFDLLARDGRVPMGGEALHSGTPRFEVRARGALQQQPGCPDESRAGLSADRLERLCRGECYHPGESRIPIRAIEVVRIRPQRFAGEPIEDLIEDPWRSFPCAPDPDGCRVTFEDADYAASGRSAVYYVRALQQPTPAINGANLRTEFDAQGRAIRTTPCHGDLRTASQDLCLAPVSERAWSSPIYLDPPVPAPILSR